MPTIECIIELNGVRYVEEIHGPRIPMPFIYLQESLLDSTNTELRELARSGLTLNNFLVSSSIQKLSIILDIASIHQQFSSSSYGTAPWKTTLS